MPELPEVETISRALKSTVVGLSITRVEVFSPAMRTSLLPLKEATIKGKKILDVRRRARYVIIELEDCKSLVMHFGMSGVLRLETLNVAKRKHEHVFFHLSNNQVLKFECPRRFSLIEFCNLDAPGEEPQMLKKLGLEPLSEELTAEYLFLQSRKSRGALKNFIMDNAVVVGVGNIYAAESLFAAGLHPESRPCNLTLEDFRKLIKEIQAVLRSAIEAGGTTFSDYRLLDGSEGRFEQALSVYGREKMPCVKCGTEVKNVKLAGRSSFYCPKCQKKG